MSSNPSNQPSSSNTEVHTYKAVPRDDNQQEHKKPRVFIHRPDEPAPDANTTPATLVDAAKSIQIDDFTKVHKTPCVRDALLPAIGGGMGVGAVRFVLGGSIMAACNWASGSFVGVSIIAYQFCQRRRKLEKEGIRRAVEVLDKKQALKEMQEKARTMGEKDEKAGMGASVGGSGAAQLSTSNAMPTSTDRPTLGQPGAERPKQERWMSGVGFWESFKFW